MVGYRSRLFLYLVIACVSLAGWDASASFSLDVDGEQLNALDGAPGSGVEFNTSRTTSIPTSGSVLFSSSSGGGSAPQDFFTIEVLESDRLLSGDDFAFSAEVTFQSINATMVPSTNAILALTDGSQFFGGATENATTSSAPFFNPTQFLVSADSGSSLSAVDNGAPFASLSDDDELTLQLDVTTDSITGRTVSSFTFLNDNGTNPSATIVSESVADDLDVSQGLSFIFASSFNSQSFRVDQVTLTFVPEPTAAALVGLGSLAVLRPRRSV